jgi:hypothetical protein
MKRNIIRKKLKNKSMKEIVRESLVDLSNFMFQIQVNYTQRMKELPEKANESLGRNYFQ